jgi:RNA-directed DNA polymerase
VIRPLRLDRAKRSYRGKGNWRIVRYADDFVILTNGSRDTVEQLSEHVIEVLGGIGWRLSETKTRIAHLREGIDFLGFHLQWKPQSGSGKCYGLTMIGAKAFDTSRPPSAL